MATVADALNEVRKRLEKKYKDSSEIFPDFTTIKEIAVIPSNSAIINVVTGIGGLPRGRVIEIYGPFSSGKTTIACECAAAAQRADPNSVVLYVDYEHAFDARYARALGVDLHPNRFIFLQPEYAEQGMQAVDEFLDTGLIDMIVIDSAAAMTPKSEMEGDFDTDGGSQKGTQAAIMSRFLSVVTKKLSKGRKPCMVLINQTRAVINIGGRPQKNAPKEQSAAGNAIKFYTSMRLELDILAKEGDENRGTKSTDQVYTQNKVRITAVKNKLAPPWIRGTFVIEYGKGINNTVSIAEMAEARLGIMSGAGFFKYNGDTPATSFSCRGREAFQDLLKTNPALLKELELKVLSHIKAEHAAALGLTEIKTSGQAKQVEGDAKTLILEAPRSAPSQLRSNVQQDDDTDIPDPSAPRLKLPPEDLMPVGDTV